MSHFVTAFALTIGALHGIAEVEQHLGDTTHAAAADADEVDGVDTPHALSAVGGSPARMLAAASGAASAVRARPGARLPAHAPPSRARGTRPPALRRMGLGELASALGHREELAAARAQLLQLVGEALGCEVAVCDQDRGALSTRYCALCGLVIVDCRGERHQDGADANSGQLGHRERTGPADHEIGPAVSLAPYPR